jgi:hypothetical protein
LAIIKILVSIKYTDNIGRHCLYSSGKIRKSVYSYDKKKLDKGVITHSDSRKIKENNKIRHNANQTDNFKNWEDFMLKKPECITDIREPTKNINNQKSIYVNTMELKIKREMDDYLQQKMFHNNTNNDEKMLTSDKLTSIKRSISLPHLTVKKKLNLLIRNYYVTLKEKFIKK